MQLLQSTFDIHQDKKNKDKKSQSLEEIAQPIPWRYST